MPASPPKSYNLPWHQSERYTICLYPVEQAWNADAKAALLALGMTEGASGVLGADAPRDWQPLWSSIYGILEKHHALASCLAAVTAQAAEMPPPSEARNVSAIQEIAESLWLGKALLEGDIVCYMQPVMNAPGKVFGYESFARVRQPDGTVIAGDKIVAASRVLGIEHMIDRHLQVQAIKTFMSSAFNGFLFVNFFPGFIHRPAVYLEALSETARSYGMVAKHLVLDFTRSETPRDIAHLRSVCEYGRSKGYSIALDDVESPEGAGRLIGDIRPDFVKIGMPLVRMVDIPAQRENLRLIVEMSHAVGATVIGECVETEESYNHLRQAGVDLFQGYYFSPPVPVEAALQAGKTA